jgi:hypothetical protein
MNKAQSSKLVDVLPQIIKQLGIRHHMAGEYIQCRCPIHPSDGDSSMTVFPDGGWQCWTSNCNQIWGSKLAGLIRALGADPEQLLKGVEYSTTYTDYEIDVDLPTFDATREEIRARLEIPSAYYLNRGFSAEILDRFDVGNSHSGPMKNRAVFPIYNQDWKLTGCAGRTLLDKAYIQKWKYSKGFKASCTFFGINHAYQSMLRTKTIVLVEGMSDVMRMQEYGIVNCVGALGAKLSKGQVKVLENAGIKNIIIALDPDPPREVNGVLVDGTGPMRTKQIIARYEDKFNFVPIELTSDPDELKRFDAERLFGNYV